MTKLSTICYIDNGSQLLLLLRNKKENDYHWGKYISVGGKFELGETPEECAIREIKEETGLTATKLDLRGFISFPNFQHDGEDWYSFVYRVTGFEGKINFDSDEGTLYWVDYDQVFEKPTWQGDYIYLDWVLDRSIDYFSAKFVYDEAGQLQTYSVDFNK
ncbi:8-oxo-dGTP diphosphatase [Ignavigranum ruoffiae]|uniref:NUDIX hydrolase n=1 Tax=Ignavigranum ruoffiae TaxID=89093 RepID=UPI002069FF1F|nr:8-oxo-dGTP diphosphatase [Ignavigranum ruoffiae]UPQ86390.1 8-oxo-dGTP diphosphatase [Ignavigranum ruoffiae]